MIDSIFLAHTLDVAGKVLLGISVLTVHRHIKR